MTGKLTAKQWERRALKAEEELKSIREMRVFEHSIEMQTHRQLAAYKVALKEAQSAIEWAIGESE